MSNGVVYAEDGVYAGWPANHGAWQWGGEWLVGFLRGKYVRQSMHNIREPFEYCFSRSMDEGQTWAVEPHGAEFTAGVVVHHAEPFAMATSIRRVCGVYDHGGDETDPHGGYFLSGDRGRNWVGPYLFDGLESEFDGGELHCTGRQCELPGRRLIFLSNASRHHWGTDRTFVAKHDGERFSFLSYVDGGDGRSVMPAVAELGDRIVVTVRRRHTNRRGGWVGAFYSDDGGASWSKEAEVGSTGSSNGNPPALIESGGVLLCAYGDRTSGTIRVSRSSDGVAWSDGEVIAQGIKSKSGYFDLGYPRLLKRADGSVVAFFYIATPEIPQQHIAWADV